MTRQESISFRLNGVAVTASVEPHYTLIELLQTQFGLTGAREACGQGLCGCCTVLVNRRAVSGCLYLASLIDGAEVATIEGLDAAGRLTPMQEAFMKTGAFQCGYCTSGFILMATQLLEEHPEPTDQQIAHYLSGNLCRCAAYPEIIAAVKLVAGGAQSRDRTTPEKP